tara:strand:+ start:7118 stop:11836 length:4719 start_codon:yes stop_codon:yes gene_type:complete
MIKRFALVVSLLLIAKTVTAQEMYFSISGKSTGIESGDTRHQYDIWIKPESGAQNGSLQIFDAGLGGVVDIIAQNTPNTTTTFQLFPFASTYSIAGTSVQAKTSVQESTSTLITKNEERFKNRWVPLSEITSTTNDGYIVRVTANEGNDINSFNFRVVSATGDVLSGTSWKIIAIDLSVGLYNSSTNKSFQLKPYLLSDSSSPNLKSNGEEDSKIEKMDSFGDKYEISNSNIPANRFGIKNNWGLTIRGSKEWLNTLTVYGADKPVLWLFEPLATDILAKPSLVVSETPSNKCVEKGFELSGTNLSAFDLNNAQWILNDDNVGKGNRPVIRFQNTGNTGMDILIPNQKTYFPEYWTYRENIFVNTPPIARLDAPKLIISPSEKVVLSAEKSYDLEGKPISYSWFVNGAQRGSDATFEFSNSISGQYNISVRVSDGGVSSTCSIDQKQVRIRVNTQPYAEIDLLQVIGTDEAQNITIINQNDSDNDSLSYRWSGDGIDGEATGTSVAVLHSKPGIYNVNLTVNDASGSSNASYSISKKYEVNAAPVPVFSLAEKAAPGDIIKLNALASSDANSDKIDYKWFLNNSLIAEEANTTYTINDPGTFEFKLVVNDGRGVSNSSQQIAKKIRINSAPVPVISADRITSLSTVKFSALESSDSETTIASYDWDFGDGDRASGPNVDHSFQRTGQYRILLTVNDGEGLANSIRTVEHNLIINQYPKPDFTAPLVVAPGEPFSTDGSLSTDADGSISSYLWLANGMSVGTSSSASITFNNIGTHNVSLRVKDDSGYEFAEGIATKSVRVNAPPVAKWKTIPDQIVPDTEIKFTAEDSYDPDGIIKEYFWKFADGTRLKGKQIQRIFSESGVQKFTLTVVDNDDLSNSSTTIEGETNVNHQPYIVTETVIRSNSLNVQLNAASSYDLDNNSLSFEWTLPDGSKRKEASFNWLASESGVHFVGLTIDDGLGLSNSKTTESIRVLINRAVKAVVESEIASCTGQTVLFNSSQSFDPDGDPFSVKWDFGNGVTSEEANPSYVYEKSGIYNAQLTLDDGISTMKTVAKIPVIIEGSPVAKLNISDTTICVNSSIIFDGSSSTDPSGALPSFSWDTGDGKSNTGPRINHVFTEPGVYNVSLTVEGSGSGRCSNISQTTATVRVIEGPEANFELPVWTEPGQTITLDGSASTAEGGIKTATWIIDGEQLQDSVSGINGAYTFNTPGEYFVTLELTTNSGTSCNTVIKTKSIKVNAPPVIAWNLSENVAAGSDIKLDALTSSDPDGYIKEYKWYLDDGFVSYNATEIIKAITPGQHKVSLEITDNSLAKNNMVVAEKTFFANSAPTPSIVMPAGVVYQNQTVTFQSGLAQDRDNDMLSSSWFVNGKAVPTPTFKAEDKNGYKITLVQNDGRGLSNSIDSAVVTFTPTPFPVVKPQVPGKIVIGGALTTADIMVPQAWKFKNQAIYEDRWIAYSPGVSNVTLAWVPAGQELTTQSFQIEVVAPLQFTQQVTPKRVAWNPANPSFILSAPEVNRDLSDVSYTWKQRGQVIGEGLQMGVKLIKGENRFTVEVVDNAILQSKPITIDIVIVTE